jgi:hypothetical protein
MNGDNGENIQVGMLVMSADGHQLGRVKAVSNTCFGVDVFLGLDYWVNRDRVADTSTGAVLLTENREYFTQRPTTGRNHEGLHDGRDEEHPIPTSGKSER